ncbi:uncharacterized protein LOC110060266 isoform X1 [Orbicella faveolata]|uniref:uncharacterized protein LOC110060266 isoform X1 n=1 Tax=Orbicella faveolata TaxID=48498 RepID=UPI0009E2F6FF|nr:uncharacterized protein LOC110060266 isoform X1 [Orbicella faveolata]
MSTTAHCVSGYGQGTDTSAVLTNRSKYITIIADEPYFSRHSRTFPPARQRKGTRPMHKTTLTYEVKPVQTTYVSCMKANFSGHKNLQPSRRPPAYPSQHTSHFSIGILPGHQLNTHSKKTYVNHNTRPAEEIHEDNIRWNAQMAGVDMVQSTRQQGSQEMNFSTTYYKVHDLLGRQRGPGVKRLPPMPYSYNIITGEPRPSQVGDDYRLTSGNRVLHSARHSDQGQQLILG